MCGSYSKKLKKYINKKEAYILSDLKKNIHIVPINIRKYIYTNNIVESVNSKVQRGFYGRGTLPNADSAINIIYVNLIDLEKKWKNTKVSNWKNIFNEIQIVHKDTLEKYM